MNFLRQSTAVDIAIGPFVDSTDGVTAETGLTISQADVRLKKNNGAWAQVNDNTAATHEENGWYEKELDATDTNTVGILIVAVNESGALPVWREFCVLEEAVYDALFAASALGYVANAPVNVAQFGGANLTATGGRPEVNLSHIAGSAVSTTTAQLGVNVVQVSGDATAADNLESYCDGTTPMPVNATQISGDTTAADNAESFFDGTGYAGTNNVIPTVTTTTNLTNAPTNGDLTATMKASVNAEVDAAIETYHLDHLLAATYDPASKPGAADALLNELVESDAGVSRFTANALEQAPSGTGASASAIADEVQTRTIAAVTVVNGLAANVITAAATAADFTTEIQSGLATAAELAKVPKSDGTATWNATALASIQAEATDALNAYDPPTRAEATSDANSILTAVGDVPTNAELATALGAADDAVLAILGAPAGASMSADIAAIKAETALILTDTGTTLDGKIDAIDTVVDAIKAKTDSLTFTTAGMVDSAVKRVGSTTLTTAGTGGQGYGG